MDGVMIWNADLDMRLSSISRVLWKTRGRFHSQWEELSEISE